ncbi:hypothetical protein TNCV_753001 [Trichonephila clavipes]|uniref:Uncharacterized protein n=1 Tax=Trichonephila clavipes TaxID=2585209 RepID=A0A8X6WAD4_TRICX|nr:hypothetical protein TNCV_753001 [Trichonephila clavipes]
MQTTVGRTRTHGYERSVNDVSVAMATKRRKLRSPEDGFCNELDALLPASSSRVSESPVYFKERPANDPKCVVIHSSEDQLASFKNFVVIHSAFSGVVIEASSSRVSESPVYFKERPANDPKCVVIHSSEDQLASFKNFVVIHSAFSGVVIEGQRIAS